MLKVKRLTYLNYPYEESSLHKAVSLSSFAVESIKNLYYYYHQ